MENEQIIDDSMVTPEVLADEKMYARLNELKQKGRFMLRREATAKDIEITPEMQAPGSNMLFISVLFEKEFGVKPFAENGSAPAKEAPAPAEAAPEPAAAPQPEAKAASPAPKTKVAKKQGAKQKVAKKPGAKSNGKPKAAPVAAAFDDSDDAPPPVNHKPYSPPAKQQAPEPAPAPAPVATQQAAPSAPSSEVPELRAQISSLSTQLEAMAEQVHVLQETFWAMHPLLSVLLPTIQTGFHRIGKEMGSHVAQDLVTRFQKVEQSVAEASEAPTEEPT